MVRKNLSKKTYIALLAFGYLTVAVFLTILVILLQPNVIRSSYTVTGEISDIRKVSDTYYITVQGKEQTIPSIVYNKTKLSEKLSVGDQYTFVIRDDIYAFEKQTDIIEISSVNQLVLAQEDYLAILKTQMLYVQLSIAALATFFLVLFVTINFKLVKSNFYQKERSDAVVDISIYKKYKYIKRNKENLDSRISALIEIYERYDPCEFEADDSYSRELYFSEIARVLVYFEGILNSGFTSFGEEEMKFLKFATYEINPDDFADDELDNYKRMSREVVELFYPRDIW